MSIIFLRYYTTSFKAVHNSDMYKFNENHAVRVKLCNELANMIF